MRPVDPSEWEGFVVAAGEAMRNPDPTDTGLLAFYPAMSPGERRAFWACCGGWVLDACDFMIYPLIIGTLIAQWRIDRAEAGLAVTLTLLGSAIGGWLVGWLADRIGRVRAMQITVLWFAVFTLLCALAQNFGQLLLFRCLLGIGFGGEWAAGAVLMGETVRPAFRGRAVGVVQSGWAVGWGLAVLMQAVFFTLAPPAIAWRLMFAAGAAPALLILLLRRWVPEPEVFATAAGDARPAPIWAIFAPDLLRTTVVAGLLGTGAQGGYYAVTTWLPTYLRTDRHLSVIGSSGYLALLILGSLSGYLFGAWLADRIGRRPPFVIFAVAASILVVAYTRLPFGNDVMLLLGFPLGFCASAYFSGFGPFLTELYPTRVRGSGQSFSYNFGRGIGALFPTLVGALSQTLSLATAIAVFALSAYALMLVAALLLPETRGRALHPA